MENNYFDKTPEKNLSFYAAIGLLAFFLFLSIGIDITEFDQHQDINIPVGFSYLMLGIDLAALACIVGIYAYRKLAVYLYPVLVLLHLILHEFYLSTFLYADLFNLFVFVGVGLLAIIPKWNFFK